jgi:glycosyltransferase involved in cell wall biosynthesis|tara:strand:- start:20798 stop:22231 length:1434 start_codon:yes stop_codon:yes gene_type:complete
MNKSFKYLPQGERKKILLICDDIRVHSGVATIARELVINTVQHFNWVNVGGAINHQQKGQRFDLSEDTNKNAGIDNSSVILYPVDGYGNAELIRQLIQSEKPDAIMLITDPRYFEWLFQIENEIRKQLPIIYLNIWDDLPTPLYNKAFYESCDALLAISKQTKLINELVLGDKAKRKVIEYVPHGLNHNLYKPIEDWNEELKSFKSRIFNNKEKEFVLFFNSRNIRRKQIPDTMLAFKYFLDKLPKEKADKCCLILHTEVVSEHGTDLEAIRKLLFNDYPNAIYFSQQKLSTEDLNKLYNIADAQILLTSNEGWGLTLTEAILAGTPIIANVTGGMQDQMGFEDEDGNWFEPTTEIPSNHTGRYKKHGNWAFPVYPTNRSIQGSPKTPYIWDDRCTPEDACDRIYELYQMGREKRKELGLQGREWAVNKSGLTSIKMGERAINAIDKLFDTWIPREKYELINTTEFKEDKINHKFLY